MICLLGGNLTASEGDSLVVSFSNPAQPGTIKTELMAGSITVKAHDGPDVHIITKESDRIDRPRAPRSPFHRDIEIDIQDKIDRVFRAERDEFDFSKKADPEKIKGLQKIQSSPYGINVEQENNVIEINLPPMAFMGAGSGDLLLLAPKSTSLQLSCLGGDVVIEGINGEIEIEAMGGNITLTSVSGAVVANTMGDIDATLDGIKPNAPMSFSTFGGDIDVTLPAAIKATLFLNSHGEIYTDFDTSKRKKRRKISKEEDKEAFRMDVEEVLEIPINGGGSEIEFSNFTGNIYIRKGK
jgi:hypothetical protein